MEASPLMTIAILVLTGFMSIIGWFARQSVTENQEKIKLLEKRFEDRTVFGDAQFERIGKEFHCFQVKVVEDYVSYEKLNHQLNQIMRPLELKLEQIARTQERLFQKLDDKQDRTANERIGDRN